MFQLHIVCKDSKVIRYLLLLYCRRRCRPVAVVSSVVSRCAAAGIELFMAEATETWRFVPSPGSVEQSSLSVHLGQRNVPTEDDLRLGLQVPFFHL